MAWNHPASKRCSCKSNMQGCRLTGSGGSPFIMPREVSLSCVLIGFVPPGRSFVKLRIQRQSVAEDISELFPGHSRMLLRADRITRTPETPTSLPAQCQQSSLRLTFLPVNFAETSRLMVSETSATNRRVTVSRQGCFAVSVTTPDHGMTACL